MGRHGTGRMRLYGAVAAGLAWACAGSACAAAPRAGAQNVPDAPPRGWSIPDDSVEALFAHANLIIEGSRVSGPYPRDVVLVSFTPGATAAQRQTALDHVGGTVIGGNGVYYYVHVTRGPEPVWWAIDRLVPLPHVAEAHPLLYNGWTPEPVLPVADPDSPGREE